MTGLTIHNSSVGAGVLTLPFAFSQAGILLGALMLVVIALLSAYTLHLLLESSVLLRDRILGERLSSSSTVGQKSWYEKEENSDAEEDDDEQEEEFEEEQHAVVAGVTSSAEPIDTDRDDETTRLLLNSGNTEALEDVTTRFIRYGKIDVYSYKALAVGAFGEKAGILFECCIFLLCIGILVCVFPCHHHASLTTMALLYTSS